MKKQKKEKLAKIEMIFELEKSNLFVEYFVRFFFFFFFFF